MASAFSFAFAAAAATASLVCCGLGCSPVSGDGRVGIDAPSGSEDQFQSVAQYLVHRCGSLDCHGQVGRNLRMWGCGGMRLDPHANPECSPTVDGGGPSTPDEDNATYRSLVGLEPAVMSAVVQGHGAHPELLTFVRKARGLEAHKGGVLIVPGDSQDVCITSWLAGGTDRTACATAALGIPAFPMDASTE
jgi:hypothetical protein